MSKASSLGINGEELAASFLVDRGYTILDRNWNLHKGYELDIVAEKDGEIVFVEVKTRSQHILASPEDAVDAKKIRRICIAADHYVKQFQIDKYFRFDIIAIILGDDKSYQIKHIENAFHVPLTSVGGRW